MRDVELGKKVDSAIGLLESAKNDTVLTAETLRCVMDDTIRVLLSIAETQRSDYPPIPQNAFHAGDGFYFRRRQGTDDVELIDRDSAFFGSGAKDIIISQSSWASIVAHLSKFGDTMAAWELAMKFHRGEENNGRATDAGEAVFLHGLLKQSAITEMPRIASMIYDRIEKLKV